MAVTGYLLRTATGRTITEAGGLAWIAGDLDIAAGGGTLTRTNRIGTQSSSGHGTGSFVTGSFTPSDDSLLVVIVGCMEDSGSSDPSGDLTISDSAGLTWTSRANTGNASAWSIGVRIWTAPVTTGTSMTVTIDCGARDIYWYGVTVADYTNYAGVGTAGTNAATATDGADSVTLAASPSATSEIIGAIMQDPTGAGGATPGTAVSHVELYEVDSLTGAAMQSQARPAGSTSAAFSWDDVGTSAALYKGVAAAIEITEAGASSTTVTAQVCTFTLSPQSAAVTVGGVTVTAQPCTFTLTPQAGPVSVGSVSTSAQVATMTLSPQHGVITVGSVTTTAQVATFTLSPQPITPTPGAVTITAQACTFTFTAVAITPTAAPGGTSTTAQACTFTLDPQPGTITPGGVTVTAQPCAFTLSPQAATITTGGVSVAAQTLTFTLSPQQGVITAGTVAIAAQVATFTLSPQQGVISTTTPGPTILGRYVYRWTEPATTTHKEHVAVGWGEPGLFSGSEPSTARWAEPPATPGGDQ